MNNYLSLGDKKYKLNTNESYFEVSVNSENKITSCNLTLNFLEGKYNNELVEPEIIINNHTLNINKLEDLKNKTLTVSNVQESLKREDSFYLYEFEPFLKYELIVKEIDEEKAHIIITGTAITNDISPSSKGEEFTTDVIVNVIKKQHINNNKIVKKPKKSKTNIILLIYALVLIITFIIIILFLN